MKRALYVVAVGFYGLVLTGCAVLTAGAGHGTYVLIGLFSAPLGFLGIPAAVFGGLVLWPAVAAGFLWAGRRRRALVMGGAFLLVHYATAWCLLAWTGFGDWRYFERVRRSAPGFVAMVLAFYALGQAGLWLSLYFLDRRPAQAVGRGPAPTDSASP